MTGIRYRHFALALGAVAALGITSGAAQSDGEDDGLTAQEDHRRMMDLLGIEEIRPGRNGMDPSHPNYANYDEATSNPYPNLPPLLEMEDGTPVTTAEQWQDQRRAEILGQFSQEIYGEAPAETPAVTWEVVSESEDVVADVPVIIRELVGHVDNSDYPQVSVDMDMTLTMPKDASEPVPAMVSFTWRFPEGFELPEGFQPPPGPTPTERLISRGWAHAEFVPTTAQADNGAGLDEGIIGLTSKGEPRDADDWGVLRAWAWGASRAFDYLDGLDAIDGDKIGIEGLSRYGKATLVTMAYDERFAIGFSGSSGEGGASLYRRDNGEIVENLAGSGAYHWMAGNFIKYAGPLDWDDLPIDAHSLIALSAPRPLFVGTGTSEEGDAWVDPVGIFKATVAATPVYELLGEEGPAATEFPGPENGLTDGTLAFRQHAGGHTNGPNWESFLDFADRELDLD